MGVLNWVSGTKKMGVPDNGRCDDYELSREDLEDQVESYVEFYGEDVGLE